MSDADVTLHDLSDADFPALIQLARSIWMAHYVPIVGAAQIEYMLAQRFTPQNLRRYVRSDQRWLKIMRLDDAAVGYLSYALTEVANEIKLEQLYLLPTLHGRGLGGYMMRQVESHARTLGADSIVLTVNKNNSSSIAVYEKTGFTVREEAVFDIGNGFVMDDYIMEKRLD